MRLLLNCIKVINYNTKAAEYSAAFLIKYIGLEMSRQDSICFGCCGTNSI